MRSAPLPSKICPTCGRSFAWRKKWERDWAEVVYCRRRCRTPDDKAAELEARILAALDRRGVVIALSEILAADETDVARIEAMRSAARRLAHRGVVEILVENRVVSPDRARGALRVRKR